MNRGRKVVAGILGALGLGALAALLGGKAKAAPHRRRKPPDQPAAEPPDAGAHAVLAPRAGATVAATSRPVEGHSYAGQLWRGIRDFVRWVEPRYGAAMDAAETAELRRLGYDNRDDWFAVQEAVPNDESARVNAHLRTLRRNALAVAIAADRETPANLLRVMAWAEMEPGHVNEDAEMYAFATELAQPRIVA